MSVSSSVGMRGSSKRLGAWALQVVVAAAFFAAGSAKLAGASSMIQMFDQIGVGQWFRIVTGLVEIFGAIALLYPGIAAFGVFGLGFTRGGAFSPLLFVLLSTPAPPAVLLPLNALIVSLRRDQLITLATPVQSGHLHPRRN